jgi:leucyl aminopeptidase
MSRNGTTFEFTAGDARGAGADVLLVPLAAKPQPALQLVSAADAVCADAVSALLAAKAVGEEVGYLAHTTSAGTCRRIVIVGLGDAEKITSQTIRRAAACAACWLVSERIGTAALWMDGLAATGVEDATSHWAGGMALAGFQFAEYRQPDEKAVAKVRVQVRCSESGHVRRELPAIRRELLVAEATNYARRLAHLPGNVINPATLAAEARLLARHARLKCTVIDAAQAKRLGMGGLLAVGGGSATPPCLIQIEYRGLPRARRRTVIVGKAITFDTGGYSIKPAAGLEAMKFDKCGGTTVLGIMKAVATLKLPCNVVGLIAAAENAVSQRAYRPGDILKMMSGKTVEVISTDAEGRLVLADALTYAQQNLKPTEMIDLATLTGGVSVALGKQAAGLMSNDDELAGELGECGRRVGERLWRLPLWPEYRDLIKGTDSDIKNSGGKRDAHAIAGGMFLKEFVDDGVAWAHLDIAGVATSEDNNTPTSKGATGFGVRLLVDYLSRGRG